MLKEAACSSDDANWRNILVDLPILSVTGPKHLVLPSNTQTNRNHQDVDNLKTEKMIYILMVFVNDSNETCILYTHGQDDINLFGLLQFQEAEIMIFWLNFLQKESLRLGA